MEPITHLEAENHLGRLPADNAICRDVAGILRDYISQQRAKRENRAPDDCFIDPRGAIRPILKYGEDGPNGARMYWIGPAREGR